ncbi:MAG: NAD(P)-dependent dehydrogenase (short-subunit alcohol dehydrogenase family) [Myxococcota bacterium]|jgi:NAD(P)-dependent dehydrogenase (short-subunit alcohol dehydrogenase family)
MSTIVVTGANRGIGLALSEILSKRGDDVIAIVRKSSEALDALGVKVHTDVDVTDDEAVLSLSARLPETIDAAILNAGILRSESLDNLDFDSIREQFEVNTLGPLRVSAMLAHGPLKGGGKIVIVTSRMGSIEDNTSGSRYGYRMSKAAVNMAGKSLATDLKPRGVAVGLVHPGYVRTDMTGGGGHIDASEAAAGIIARMDGLSVENTGSFWHQNGESLPW